MIDLGRAIQYPFSGQNAVAKIMIGTLLTIAMVPTLLITLFMLLGYQLRVIRDVIDGDDGELPEWNHLGEDLVQGGVVFLGTLIYYLPSLILTGLGASLLFETLRDVNFLDFMIHHDLPDFDRVNLSMAVLTFALALIWLLLSAPLVMAATAHYAETGQFSAFTHMLTRADEIWEQRGAATMLMLYLFLAGLLAQTVNAVISSMGCLCFISSVVQFLHLAVVWHLNGQWGRLLKSNRSVIRPLRPR